MDTPTATLYPLTDTVGQDAISTQSFGGPAALHSNRGADPPRGGDRRAPGRRTVARNTHARGRGGGEPEHRDQGLRGTGEDRRPGDAARGRSLHRAETPDQTGHHSHAGGTAARRRPDRAAARGWTGGRGNPAGLRGRAAPGRRYREAAMTDTPAIHTRELWKRYGNMEAVRGLNLRVAPRP